MGAAGGPCQFHDNRPMQTTSHPLWRLRLVTLLAAAGASASASYWALKFNAVPPALAKTEIAAPRPRTIDPQFVARALGGSAQGQDPGSANSPLEAEAARFKLAGIVSAHKNGGYALISIDGQAAKPFSVGARINESWVLRSVQLRSATLSTNMDAPTSMTLELPKLSPP